MHEQAEMRETCFDALRIMSDLMSRIRDAFDKREIMERDCLYIAGQFERLAAQADARNACILRGMQIRMVDAVQSGFSLSAPRSKGTSNGEGEGK